MIDEQVRLVAFKWMEEQVLIHGDVLPRILLEKGFLFKQTGFPCAKYTTPQKIFWPDQERLEIRYRKFKGTG
jgi:hypothetical protein